MNAPAKRCLVAYGNELRGDDGAAWELARQLAGQGWVIFARVQLLPELSADLCDFEEVVFADASPQPGEPSWTELKQSECDGWPVHCGRPQELLGLCRQLYGRAPRAWMLSLPGDNFEYRLGLSPRARFSVKKGLRQLRQRFGD